MSKEQLKMWFKIIGFFAVAALAIMFFVAIFDAPGFVMNNFIKPIFFFIPLCIGTITLTLWKATSSRIFPLLGMAILLLHTFSFIYVLAMALTIGSLGIYLFLAFYYFMVLIPLAYGYLADKASNQTP